MGRHMSSIKRARQTEIRNARNKHVLSTMRTSVKKARIENSPEALKVTIPVIAKAAQKGVIHKKKASRLISRLSKAAKAS
ncbi:MAG: 30S ribosomal protein S20 [Deltaproteobacteria bacterium]|nr:30S ribosomal protein S20 [Deltaproteobacteria bacterium]